MMTPTNRLHLGFTRTPVAMALTENIQREEPTEIEAARAPTCLIDQCSLAYPQAAESVRGSSAAVSNLIRLFDLPAEVLRSPKERFGPGPALARTLGQRRTGGVVSQSPGARLDSRSDQKWTATVTALAVHPIAKDRGSVG
jgi:hypothetical protein